MRYEVKRVVCDWGVFENDKLIIILNSHDNAKALVDLIEFDKNNQKVIIGAVPHKESTENTGLPF